MMVITTPTGQIGRQLVTRLLDAEAAVRIIARDPSQLDPAIHEQVDVVDGSHGDRAVLDRALPDADALFWLVPPNSQAASAQEHYLAFAQAGSEAIRRHDVAHVVAVSSAGHDWSTSAGLLSAAFAMDAELERSGAAYRALSMPFYMENLLGQLDTIHQQGAFYLTYATDRPLALIATRDIADTADTAPYRPLLDRAGEPPRLRARPTDPGRDGRDHLRRARPARRLPPEQPGGFRLDHDGACDLSYIVVLTARDGQIARYRDYWNPLSFASLS